MNAAALVRQSGSSFAWSFSFLPRRQKEALKTVYAFCRTTDDIVDNAQDVRARIERLSSWRRELERAMRGDSASPLLNRLHAIARQFNIPVEHFYELLRGVEMDLVVNRYATFAELEEYCALVASSVGLMSLEIFGPRNDRTIAYAYNLGIALQLTNILRDVGVDAGYGRIYLPLEDLRRFGCAEEEILAGKPDPEGFRALMEFEAARAETYFTRAREALGPEHKRAMFAPKIMERIYYHTLLRMRETGYRVFDAPPVRLPKLLQFLIAVKYWVKQRILGR